MDFPQGVDFRKMTPTDMLRIQLELNGERRTRKRRATPKKDGKDGATPGASGESGATSGGLGGGGGDAATEVASGAVTLYTDEVEKLKRGYKYDETDEEAKLRIKKSKRQLLSYTTKQADEYSDIVLSTVPGPSSPVNLVINNNNNNNEEEDVDDEERLVKST